MENNNIVKQLYSNKKMLSLMTNVAVFVGPQCSLFFAVVLGVLLEHAVAVKMLH